MATFYLDYEGGNDANDGTTFANRWKTFTSGATAARIAPGDTIRVMASPDPTLVGNATWTQGSKTVTLAAAVTANISDCETAWTASANVTATASTTQYKENTKSANLVIASAFTTGLAAYFATGTLDLSSYQQVSFWFRTSATIAASTLSLRLCSDVAGVTTVNTIAIPAVAVANNWVPITVDTGGALGASIKSVALYCDLDPGAVTINLDNIIACKASSSADSLTLTSLLGKVWNLSWAASTTYATNDIRKPTQPNRNGFRYKVTAGGGGSSGSSEPTWPLYIGGTVTDGALTWTCEGIEDTWYGIQSINGTTVKLDNDTTALGNAGRGYGRETETVSTYKRETIKTGISSANIHTIQDSGSVGSPIVFSGGWNRTDMSTQTGETWYDNQSATSTMFVTTSRTYIDLYNLSAVRCARHVTLVAEMQRLYNCHANNVNNVGISIGSPNVWMTGVSASMGGTNGVVGTAAGPAYAYRLLADGNLTAGVNYSANTNYAWIEGSDWRCENNTNYGVYSAGLGQTRPINGLVTQGNGTAGVNANSGVMYLRNASLAESTGISTPAAGARGYVYSHNHGQVANTHLIVADGGTIQSATDQRHTASGISWKFQITATTHVSAYPLSLSVAKVAITANTATTIGIWVYRDNTNIQGQLRVAGGQAAGVAVDITTAMAPSINTWTQYTLNVTPTENCVIEVMVDVWDGVGTTNSFWIDDLSVS